MTNNDLIRLGEAFGDAQLRHHEATLSRTADIPVLLGRSSSEDDRKRLIDRYRDEVRKLDYAEYVCSSGSLLVYSLVPELAPNLHEYKEPFRKTSIAMKIAAIERRLEDGPLVMEVDFVRSVHELGKSLLPHCQGSDVAPLARKLNEITSKLLAATEG